MENKTKGRILLILAALFWGLAGVCVKSLSWSPTSIIAVRSIISLIMLGIYKGGFKIKLTKTNILGAMAMSACGILYIFSIKLTTAGTAIVLQYIAPILVFLYTVIFQKKKASPIEVILTFTTFLGCVLSFADSIDMTHLLGNILAILSGFAFATQIIIMNREDSDSQDAMMLSNLICFIICFPTLFFDEGLVFDAKNIIWILILSIFQYGLGNILFSIGIKLVDKIEGSLLLTIEPIFNPIPVAIFCNEKMGPISILGFVIVLISTTSYSIINDRKDRYYSGEM